MSAAVMESKILQAVHENGCIADTGDFVSVVNAADHNELMTVVKSLISFDMINSEVQFCSTHALFFLQNTFIYSHFIPMIHCSPLSTASLSSLMMPSPIWVSVLLRPRSSTVSLQREAFLWMISRSVQLVLYSYGIYMYLCAFHSKSGNMNQSNKKIKKNLSCRPSWVLLVKLVSDRQCRTSGWL